MTEAWRAAWVEVAGGSAPEARLAATLGGLAGVVPLDPSLFDIDAATALPAELVPHAAGRLRQATPEGGTDVAAAWSPLVEAAGRAGAPAVLRAWRQADEGRLAWLGATCELSAPGSASVSRWDALDLGPAGRAAAAALRDQAPALKDWLPFCRSMPRSVAPLAAAWAERILRAGRVIDAYQLAMAVERVTPSAGVARLQRAWTPEVFRAVAEPQRCGAAKMLASVVRGGECDFAHVCLPLLLWWDNLTDGDQRRLGAELDRPIHAGFISPMFAHLAAGRRLPPHGPFALKSGEEAFLRAQLTWNPSARARVMALLGTPSAGPVMRVALLAALIDAAQSPGEPVIATDLRAVRNGWVLEQSPAWTVAEAAEAARVVAGFVPSPDPSQLPADRVTSLAELRACAALLGRQLGTWWDDRLRTLLPEVLGEAAADLDAAAFWQERFREGGLLEDPVFRLVGPPGRLWTRPTAAEENTLLRLPSGATFLRYLWSFEELTPPLYGRLLLVAAASDGLEPWHFRALARVAREADDQKLYDVLLRGAVLRPDGQDGPEWHALAAELATPGGDGSTAATSGRRSSRTTAAASRRPRRRASSCRAAPARRTRGWGDPQPGGADGKEGASREAASPPPQGAAGGGAPGLPRPAGRGHAGGAGGAVP